MCGCPAPYDRPFLYRCPIRFTGSRPFGHSGCLGMKPLHATGAGLPLRAVAEGTVPREPLPRHGHPLSRALALARAGGAPVISDDAIGQAGLFANLMAWPGPSQP